MKTKIISLAAAALLAGSSFALAQTAGNNANVGAPGTTPGQEMQGKDSMKMKKGSAAMKKDKMKTGGSATGATGMKASGSATTTNGQSGMSSQTNGSGNIGTGKGAGTGN